MKVKPKTDEQKTAQATQELRELIREAHGVLKDFRQERQSLEQLVAHTRDGWVKQAQEFVDKEVQELFDSLNQLETRLAKEITDGYKKLWTELNTPIPELPGEWHLMDALKAGMQRTKDDIVRGAEILGYELPEEWEDWKLKE